MVDPISLVIITAVVLGVLLLVLAVIALVVLLPPVRRALRERRHEAARIDQVVFTEFGEEGRAADLLDAGD